MVLTFFFGAMVSRETTNLFDEVRISCFLVFFASMFIFVKDKEIQLILKK